MEQMHERILTLAAKIVSAHVGNNNTPSDALPGLIRKVYDTLVRVNPEPNGIHAEHVIAAPAIEKNQLVCLECDMTMKMLKRHLITVHGLTPEEYRERHNLSADYPMVTADYAALRSSLAKQSGLGKRPESLNRRRGWR